MPDTREFLSTCPWFAEAPDEALALLAGQAQWREFEPGEHVYRSGEMPDAVFGVQSGLCKVVIGLDDGRDAVSTVVPAGEWFGEVFLLARRDYFADCIAMESSRLLCLPDAALSEARRRWVSIDHRLVEFISRKSLHMIWMAVQYKVADPEARLANRLNVALNWTPHAAGDEWVTLRERLSHELLAQMLGLSRPRVTLAIRALTAAGVLIARRGRIEVHVAKMASYLRNTQAAQTALVQPATSSVGADRKLSL